MKSSSRGTQVCSGVRSLKRSHWRNISYFVISLKVLAIASTSNKTNKTCICLSKNRQNIQTLGEQFFFLEIPLSLCWVTVGPGSLTTVFIHYTKRPWLWTHKYCTFELAPWRGNQSVLCFVKLDNSNLHSICKDKNKKTVLHCLTCVSILSLYSAVTANPNVFVLYLYPPLK